MKYDFETRISSEEKVLQVKELNEKRKAAMSLAGLWIDHDDSMTVEDTVRSLRRGRRDV